MSEMRFFNPYSDVQQTENRLPHWQQSGATYFVTFRLGDALPKRLLTNWEIERQNWLRLNPQPWSQKIEQEYHERFSGAIEQWLDAGHGSCLLRGADCASIVANALRHFDGERVALLSFVVMLNHVHALFVQNLDWPLEELLRSWKRFTSRQINLLLERSGSLWQRDYFDRLVRDHDHFANCVRYIRRNPKKAKLCVGEFIVYASELAQQVE
jgi:REP element-mobilizing transposase RayT